MRKHSRTHDLPWTCEVPDCEYSEIGFVSRQMRDRHLDRAHRADEPSTPVSSAAANEDEALILVKTLVREDKLVGVGSLRQLLDKAWRKTRLQVLDEVASSGTYDQMELLWSMETTDPGRNPDKSWLSDLDFIGDVLASSLRNANSQALRWTQTKAQNLLRISPADLPYITHFCKVWKALMESDEPEMFYREYAETWFIAVGTYDNMNSEFSVYGYKSVRETRGEPSKEGILLSLWNNLKGKAIESKKRKQPWSMALRSVSRTTCSLRLAEWLLEHGARVKDKYGVSSIAWAARKDSAKAAGFLRYLLYHGDYEETIGIAETLSMMTGPKGIHKWLGVTWEELIEQAKEVRTEENTLSPSDS